MDSRFKGALNWVWRRINITVIRSKKTKEKKYDHYDSRFKYHKMKNKLPKLQTLSTVPRKSVKSFSDFHSKIFRLRVKFFRSYIHLDILYVSLHGRHSAHLFQFFTISDIFHSAEKEKKNKLTKYWKRLGKETNTD